MNLKFGINKSNRRKEKIAFPWIKLQSNADLEEVLNDSSGKCHVLFKHSTRCSISSTALNRIDSNAVKASEQKNTKWHLLDLIAFRQVSNNIELKLNVIHESPQILIVRNGDCIYHNSHLGIRFDEILEKCI